MQKVQSTPTIVPRIHRLDRSYFALQSAGFSLPTLVILAVLVAAPVFIGDEYVLHLMIVSLLFGAQAMAFDMTAGYINVVNFGFAAFVGVGAYTSGIIATRFGLSPWFGFLFAPITAGLLGFLTGILTLRLRGIYAAVMAWFVGLTLTSLAVVNVGITRGQLGLIVPLLLPTTAQLPYYYIILAIAVLTFVILRIVTHSHVGLAFRAIGQNLDAARASGVDPTRYKVLNFTLSCSLAGLLGVFYAHYIGILTPNVMQTQQTVQVLALAYIGGRGSIWGGLLAAFLVIPIFESLKQLFEIRLIIYGMLLILTMIFYPAGLVGIIASVMEWIKRRRSASLPTASTE